MPGVDRRPVFNPVDIFKSDYFNRAIRWMWKNRATDDLVEINDQWQLRDEALSLEAGMLRSRFESFEKEFLVFPAIGLSVNYTGGTITLETGLKKTIAAGQVAVFNNATTYIFVDAKGFIASSITIPSRWFPLALVRSVNGTVTDIEDLRERYRIAPISRTISAFGSGGYEGDLVVSSVQSWSNYRYVNNLHVTSTGVINVPGGFLYIKAAGDVRIDGAINVTAIVGGAFGLSTINVTPGFVFYGEPGSGIGRSGGINSIGATPYPYRASLGLGSGGSVGFNNCNVAWGSITTGRGGNGGGSLWIEAAGRIIINGVVTANGSNATAPVIVSASATTSEIAICGNSGGSGGTIWLGSLTEIVVGATAQLLAKGSNGSTGVVTPPAYNAYGGAGGGGGWIIFSCENTIINANSIYSVSGGLPGGNTSNGINPTTFYGGTGGAAFGGTGGAASPPTAGSSGQIIQQPFSPI